MHKLQYMIKSFAMPWLCLLVVLMGMESLPYQIDAAYAQVPCGASSPAECSGTAPPPQMVPSESVRPGGGSGGRRNHGTPWNELGFCTQCNVAARDYAYFGGERGDCCVSCIEYYDCNCDDDDGDGDEDCDTCERIIEPNEQGKCPAGTHCNAGCWHWGNYCENNCWVNGKVGDAQCYGECKLFEVDWTLACVPDSIKQNKPEDKLNVTLTGPHNVELECRVVTSESYGSASGNDYYGNHTGAAELGDVTSEIASQAGAMNCTTDEPGGDGRKPGVTHGDNNTMSPTSAGCAGDNDGQGFQGPQLITYECAPTACWDENGTVDLAHCDFPQGNYTVNLGTKNIAQPLCHSTQDEPPPVNDECYAVFDSSDVRYCGDTGCFDTNACADGACIDEGLDGLTSSCGNNACPCEAPNVKSINKDKTCLPGERVIIQSLAVEVSRPVVPYEGLTEPGHPNYYPGSETIWCHLPAEARGQEEGTQYVEMAPIQSLTPDGVARYLMQNGECKMQKDVDFNQVYAEFVDAGFDPSYFNIDTDNPPSNTQIPLMFYDPANSGDGGQERTYMYVEWEPYPDVPNGCQVVHSESNYRVVQCTVFEGDEDRLLALYPGLINTPVMIAAGDSSTNMGVVNVRSLSCPKKWDVHSPPRNVSLGESGSCEKVQDLGRQIPHLNIFERGQDPFGIAHSITTAVNQLEAKQTDRSLPVLFVAITEPVRKCLAQHTTDPSGGSIYPDAKPNESKLLATKWGSNMNDQGEDAEGDGHLDVIRCQYSPDQTDFADYFKALEDAAKRVKAMGGYVVVLAMSCQSEAFLSTIAEMSTAHLNLQAFAPEGVVIGDCGDLGKMDDDEAAKVKIADGSLYLMDADDQGLFFRKAFATSHHLTNGTIFFSDFMAEVAAELAWVVARNNIGREICANSLEGSSGDEQGGGFCDDTGAERRYNKPPVN